MIVMDFSDFERGVMQEIYWRQEKNNRRDYKRRIANRVIAEKQAEEVRKDMRAYWYLYW